MKPVYVVGSGGHSKVVATVLQAAGMPVAGHLDDDAHRVGQSVLGRPVVGNVAWLERHLDKAAICAVGDNGKRSEGFRKLRKLGIEIVTAVHPSCVLHESVRIGAGSVLCAGVLINVDTRLGANSIVNTGASIDHDCVIGDHVHIAPGTVIAGTVRIEDGAFLGIGVRVIPGIRIGAGAIVGAGAVVIRDVPPGTTVVGVPARALPHAQDTDQT